MSSPPPIRELSENVIHKIAAGEVVERPVSVVKELVENALDAGATRIQVEFKKGGIDSIRVSDDGHGIDPKQLPLALKRHATSKISNAEDLFSLNTLGFRGEALPAIASVSEFKIESATGGTEPVGYALEVKEGKVGPLQELARNRGTQVSVRNLFCTTPARKKFLKQPETEWGHIADLMTALAMGRLDVAWEVLHQGKTFLSCPASSDPRERALDLFGKEAAENLFPLEREVSEVGIWGLIGHPNFCKKNNRQLYVYVNGRYVQDRLLNHAIVSGYRSLLMTGQYPMAVLHLNIAPALVDVNVHPSKREVKFSNGNAIHHLISETIARALEQAPWKGGATPSQMFPGSGSSLLNNYRASLPGLLPQVRYPGGPPSDVPPAPSHGKDSIRFKLGGPLSQQKTGPVPGDGIKIAESLYDRKPTAQIGTLPFAKLQLIGQFHLTYLVCEHEGSLVLVDQHAAHERIGFEKLKSAFEGQGIAQQGLLMPLTFETSPQDGEKLQRHLEDFRGMGFEIDLFGEHTFVLKAHPTLLPKGDWVAIVRDLLEAMEGHDPRGPWREKIDHCLATMACHRQIRAGDRLNHEEMTALLEGLEGTPRSYHCPHGRPVMVEIAAREIEKWFKRIV
jgi:DNA mismatch repair protein MutL